VIGSNRREEGPKQYAESVEDTLGIVGGAFRAARLSTRYPGAGCQTSGWTKSIAFANKKAEAVTQQASSHPPKQTVTYHSEMPDVEGGWADSTETLHGSGQSLAEQIVSRPQPYLSFPTSQDGK
jgi:hypothetical protein